MNVQHFEKGVRYNDRELLVLVRKIGKLATYCKRLKNADSGIRVEAEKRETKKARDQVKVMITVDLPKKTLRAESRRPAVLDAVDRCIEKLEPQIKRYKEQHTGRQRAHERSRGRSRRLLAA
jgi:ribosomal subunit interface protein